MAEIIDISNCGSIKFMDCHFEGTKESRNRFEWLLQNRDLLMFCLKNRLPLPRYPVRISEDTAEVEP